MSYKYKQTIDWDCTVNNIDIDERYEHQDATNRYCINWNFSEAIQFKLYDPYGDYNNRQLTIVNKALLCSWVRVVGVVIGV